MKRLLFISLLCSVSCATTYHALDVGGGYSDIQLGRSTFRVKFAGNGWASADDIEHFFLHRCAELTLRRGFQYFVIVDEANTDYARQVQTSPETTHIEGQIQQNYPGSQTFSAVTTTTPAGHIVVHSHATSGVIRCFSEDDAPEDAMDAKDVLKRELRREE